MTSSELLLLFTNKTLGIPVKTECLFIDRSSVERQFLCETVNNITTARRHVHLPLRPNEIRVSTENKLGYDIFPSTNSKHWFTTSFLQQTPTLVYDILQQTPSTGLRHPSFNKPQALVYDILPSFGGRCRKAMLGGKLQV